MTRRFFYVTEDVFSHPLFEGDAFSRREAWLYLCGKAVWKDCTVSVGKASVQLRRGQLLASRSHLSSVWGWTEKQVRMFMASLRASFMIEMGQQKGQVPNVITICNYDAFQTKIKTEGQQKGQQEAEKRASKRATEVYNKDNNNLSPNPFPGFGGAFENEGIEAGDLAPETASEPTPEPAAAAEPAKPAPDKPAKPANGFPAEFEAVWFQYPEKGRNGKQVAYKHWRSMSAADRAALPECITAYVRFLDQQKADGFNRRPKDFSGWLNASGTSKGGATYVDYMPRRDSQQPVGANFGGGIGEGSGDRFSTLTRENWRDLIEAHAGTKWDIERLGLPPCSPLCRVPADLIKELDLADKYTHGGSARNLHHPNHPARRHMANAATMGVAA